MVLTIFSHTDFNGIQSQKTNKVIHIKEQNKAPKSNP